MIDSPIRLKRTAKYVSVLCALGVLTTAVFTVGLKLGLVQAVLFLCGIQSPTGPVFRTPEPAFTIRGDSDANLGVLLTIPGWDFRRFDVFDVSLPWTEYVRNCDPGGDTDVPSWVSRPTDRRWNGWVASELCGWPFGTLVSHHWPLMKDDYGPAADALTYEQFDEHLSSLVKHRIMLDAPQSSEAGYSVYLPGAVGNTIVFALAWLALFRLRRLLIFIRWKRRIHRGRCGHCAYPIDDLNPARCPECGKGPRTRTGSRA